MRIDKRVKALPWPEEYHGGQQDFIVTFSWPVVDHEKLLVADFVRNRDKVRYNTPGPDFRLVCSKKRNCAAVLYKGERAGKRHDLERALYGFSTNPRSCYPEISMSDEIALAKWLRRRGSDNHLMPELAAWVTAAQKAEMQAERDARGELRDEDVTLCPETLPEGLVEYIRREVLPEDNVLIYKKGNVRGTCYCCGEKVRAQYQRFRQNSFATCPSCGRKVWCYLEGSDRFKVDYVENIAALQKGTDGQTVFIRQWHLCRDPSATWEDIPAQLEEVARYAVRGSRVAKWMHEGKENYYMKSWRFRLDGWERTRDVTRIYDGQYYFYLQQDWKEQLAGTSLQYCTLDEYVGDAEATRRERNPIRFLLDWGRYPVFEKWWKAGYKKLVNERIAGIAAKDRGLIDWNETDMKRAVRFPARFLKALDPDEWNMKKIRRATKSWELCKAGTIRERDVMDLVDMDVNIEDIQIALGYASLHKVLRYLEENIAIEREERKRKEERAKELGRHYYPSGTWSTNGTYRDYLKECVTLGLDLSVSMILFPRNLKQAHARTSAQIEYKTTPEQQAAFLEQSGKAQKLAWEQGNLLIRPPVNGEELIEEGAFLNHCVGGYVADMAEGKTTIMLIRRVDDPDTPFYTLEWRDGQVIQCRTDSNESYEWDTEVSEFVSAWVKRATGKNKKRKTKKEAHAA